MVHDRFKAIAKSELIPGNYEGDLESLFAQLLQGMLCDLVKYAQGREVPLMPDEEICRGMIERYGQDVMENEGGHIFEALELKIGGYLVREVNGKGSKERWAFVPERDLSDDEMRLIVRGSERLSGGDIRLLSSIRSRGKRRAR